MDCYDAQGRIPADLTGARARYNLHLCRKPVAMYQSSCPRTAHAVVGGLRVAKAAAG